MLPCFLGAGGPALRSSSHVAGIRAITSWAGGLDSFGKLVREAVCAWMERAASGAPIHLCFLSGWDLPVGPLLQIQRLVVLQAAGESLPSQRETAENFLH